MPFAIVDGVPLSVDLGHWYQGFDSPSEVAEYLAYCRTNGAFRTQPFAKVTSITASNAMNKLFASAAWKALKWRDEGVGFRYTMFEGRAKELLWLQVRNLANPAVQRMGAGRLAGETNRASGVASSPR
jgi:hypothetical protein